MRYQRTQIYLDPEDHRRLSNEAQQRGISLAALLRLIVSDHVSEGAPTYEPKSFDAITAIFDSGRPADIARDFDKELAVAMNRRYAKTTDAPAKRPRRASSKRAPRR